MRLGRRMRAVGRERSARDAEIGYSPGRQISTGWAQFESGNGLR